VVAPGQVGMHGGRRRGGQLAFQQRGQLVVDVAVHVPVSVPVACAVALVRSVGPGAAAVNVHSRPTGQSEAAAPVRSGCLGWSPEAPGPPATTYATRVRRGGGPAGGAAGRGGRAAG